MASVSTTNPSPGKQPLSARTLDKIFNSGDSALTMLFATADSLGSDSNQTMENTFSSIDTADFWRSKELMSITNSTTRRASRSLSQTYIAKMLASKDSVFASFDPLPFRSLDESGQALEMPGIFESKDWMGGYEGDHKDINYTAGAVFKTSDAPPLVVADSSKWMEFYKKTLDNPMDKTSMTPIESKLEEMVTSAVVETKPTGAQQKKKKPSRSFEPEVKVYVEATDDDILCERGGKGNQWPGNERYREVVEETKPVYHECAKYEKTLLSQKIVDQMHEEGRRFLKLDKGCGEYYVVTNLVARRKAGQALREENTPEARREKRMRYKK